MDDDQRILYDKVTDLEDKSRRNNLRFDGLSQARDKDWHISEVKIKNSQRKTWVLRTSRSNVLIQLEKK